MATLEGQSIASSYEQLLHVDTDGGGNTTTLVPIKDGDNGTTFCLQLSTTKAMIEGSGSKLFFSDEGGEYISGDSTDLTLTSGSDIHLTAANDVNIPVNVGLRFGDGGENIETDNTDFTITSGGALSIAASPLSFSGAATIDTSGNNLLTLQGATAGVRIDDFLGIDTAPTINSAIISNRTLTSTSNYAGIDINGTITLGSGGVDFWGAVIGNYTVNEHTTGEHTTIAQLGLQRMTVNDGGGDETVINLASLYIENAPVAGSTPTNGPYAIFVDAGDCRFDGDLIMGTSGKGISFAATADSGGTMTSETLDDYEEGTWTAVINAGGASLGALTTEVCRYTKIGNRVFFHAYIGAMTKNAETGAITISGLPFNTESQANGGFTAVSHWAYDGVSFANALIIRTNVNADSLVLQETTEGGVGSDITDAEIANDINFMFSGHYIAA